MALQYIVVLLLFGSSSIQSESVLPNGCPADFHIHRLLSHETECGQFYQCSNGQRILMHCAPGTLFSEEMQICNWPYLVDCPSTTIEPTTVELITEESTTSKLTTEDSDKETTVKHITTEEITEKYTTVETEEHTTTEQTATTLEESKEESEQSIETEENETADYLPNGCPKDFSIHLLLPHETECDKFYQCSNGIKYLMPCGAGTLFDNISQICNWPHLVECPSTSTKPTTVEPVTKESTSSKLTTEDNDKETTVKLTTTKEITEKYTTVEYTTTEKTATTLEESTVELTTEDSSNSTIPDVTTYNPDITTQDFTTTTLSSNSTNEHNTAVTQSSIYTTVETEEYTTTEQTATTLEESTDYLPNGCPKDFSIHLLLPHETECDKFYQCSNGIKYLMPCGAGTIFDNISQICNWPHLVECPSTTTKPTTVEIVTEESTTSKLTTEGNDKETTAKLTTTEEITEYTTTEQTPTTLEESTVELTTEDSSNSTIPDVTTYNPDITTQDFTTTTLSTNSTNEHNTTVTQSSIYTTVEYGTETQNSNDTTVTQSSNNTTEDDVTETPSFNSTTEGYVTDTPNSNYTTEGYATITESSSSTIEDTGYSTDGDIITQYPDNSTTQELITVTEILNPTTEEDIITTVAPICPAGVFGNVPHPERCDAYYLCSAGIAFEVACASGFEFDPVSKVCVEIAEGGCTLSSVTDNENENNFTTTEFPTNTEEITDTSVTEDEFNTSDQDVTTKPGNAVTEEIKETTTAELLTDYPGILEITTLKYATDGHVDEVTDSWINGNVTDGTTQKPDDFTSEGNSDQDTDEPHITTEDTKVTNEGTTADYITEDEGSLTNNTVTQSPGFPSTEDFTATTQSPNYNTTDESNTTTLEPICSVGVFGNVPHPERCDAYYLCSAGKAFEVACASGFEFDPVSKVCVEIAEGGCTLSSVTDNENKNNSTTTEFPTNTEEITNTSVTEGDTNTSDQDVTTNPGNAVTDEIKETTTAELLTNYPGNLEITTLKYTTDGHVDEVTKDSTDVTNTDGFSNSFSTEVTDSWINGNGTDGNSDEDITDEPHITTEDTKVTNEATTADYITEDEGSLTNNTVTQSPGFLSTEDLTATTQSPNYNTTDESNTTTLEPICPVGVFGNVPHPERCNAYFLCSGGLAFEIYCSEGFEFDPDLRECVEISQGGCTLGPITTEENIIISSTTVKDTNSETTTESHNEAEEVTDEETAITDAPWNVPAPIVPVPPGINPGVNPEPVYPEAVTERDIDEDGDSIPDVPEPTCPPDVFGNIPHETRCDVYYLCSAGIAFEVLCPDGFEFDPNTKNCAEIAEGGCTLGANTNLLLKISPLQRRNSETEQNKDNRKEKICNENLENMPHEELCTSFYKCVEGEMIQFYCNEGFEFEPRLKKCVPMTDTGCTAYKKFLSSEVAVGKN